MSPQTAPRSAPLLSTARPQLRWAANDATPAPAGERFVPRFLPGRGERGVDVLRVFGLALVIFLHASGLLLLSLDLGESEWAKPDPELAAAIHQGALEVQFIERREIAPPLPRQRREPEAPKARPVTPQPPPELVAVEKVAVSSEVAAPAPVVESPRPPDPVPTPAEPAPVESAAPAASEPVTAPTASEPPPAPAPASRPLTRAERARAAREQNEFLRQLMAWLAQHRTYPDAAKKDKTQGTAVVRFTIDRQGRVLSASIDRSSGATVLDAAALEVLQRASPVPAMPDSMGRDRLTISLPIEYALNTD